jgi:diguanylate cyclase (GGDEF)-like protein
MSNHRVDGAATHTRLWHHLRAVSALRNFLEKWDVTRDPALVRARASGERVVSVVRIIFVAAFVLITRPEGPALVSVAVAAVIYASLLLWLAWQTEKTWLSWVTCATDVTLISATLISFVIMGEPLFAIRNRVIFELYFLAITTAGLRYDWRVCLFALGLAISQYGGMFLYASHHWDLAAFVGRAQPDVYDPINTALRVLTLFAQGATIVTIASWALHLRLLISRDPLTGLAQRRPFLERVTDEFSRARGGQAPLAMALLDLDEFKKFNDSFGHVAGDEALRQVGGCLTACVRGSDLVTRYGGEEFLIAFPGISADQAIRRAEEIRTRIENTPLLVNGTSHRLTVSIGVAAYPADGRSFDQVFEEADRRLYQAKLQGRNRSIGPPPPRRPPPPLPPRGSRSPESPAPS